MNKVVAKKARATKTTPYDVSEHLRTPEEMAAYLDAWLDEAPDDAAGIARALGDIARAKGMSQVFGPIDEASLYCYSAIYGGHATRSCQGSPR